MTEGSLCLKFIGFAVDEQTGDEQPVCYRYRVAADDEAVMEVNARGYVTNHPLGRTRAVGIRTLHERLFGGGAGGDSLRPSEVVNIDGSPRPQIRDRWRKRWERIESAAAD